MTASRAHNLWLPLKAIMARLCEENCEAMVEPRGIYPSLFYEAFETIAVFRLQQSMSGQGRGLRV